MKLELKDILAVLGEKTIEISILNSVIETLKAENTELKAALSPVSPSDTPDKV